MRVTLGPRSDPVTGPLLERFVFGDAKMVEFLLQHGAKPDIYDSSGTTPFHLAVMGDRLDIVRLLLKFGADANSPGRDGVTPLMFASFGKGDLKVIAALIAAGARVNQPARDGGTPLMAASTGGAAQYLIDHGARIDTQDDSGQTALHSAVIVESLDVTRLLISRGASLYVRDKDGHTPLYYAYDARNWPLFFALAIAAYGKGILAAVLGVLLLICAFWVARLRCGRLAGKDGASFSPGG
ncbi:MAG: ankyrin repeat domain-containing protein [Armatimonadota bacterium]